DRGRVEVAAAVVDLRLDDAARLGVAGLGRAGRHRGGSAEQHDGADGAGQELLAESHLLGLPTTVGILTRASHGTLPGSARTAPPIPSWVQEETLVGMSWDSNN